MALRAGLLLGLIASLALARTVDEAIDEADRLQEAGQLPSAVKIYSDALANPAITPSQKRMAHNNAGMCHAGMGHSKVALKHFKKALKLDKGDIELLFNVGLTYLQMQELSPALKYFLRIVKLQPTMRPAHIKVAFIMKQLGQSEGVIRHLNAAIQLAPNAPDAMQFMAETLNDLKRFKESAAMYRRSLSIDNGNPMVHMSLAETLHNQKEYAAALSHYEQSLAIHPSNGEALAGLFSIKQELCDYREAETVEAQLMASTQASISKGEPSPLAPYTALFSTTATLRQLQAIGESWSLKHRQKAMSVLGVLPKSDPLWAAAQIDVQSGAKDRRYRVGYISRRFERYAGTQLMLGVFGGHDRESFEVYCYAHGPDDGSTERQAVKAGCDTFVEVQHMNITTVAKTVFSDKLDILIDYDGHHHFNNLEVLAMRVAPVQATFLGFAGTTGAAGYVDFILSDREVVRPESASYFSESTAYLPATYQVQDFQHFFSKGGGTAAENRLDGGGSREDYGLAKDAFVLCSFNRAAKVSNTIFNVWTGILQRVPRAVLWLLSNGAEADAALRATTAAAGISPDRVVFAASVPKLLHLRRHKHADLFLDTLSYNAHTTAADALHQGLPVLTCPGSTFASRVSASLLKVAARRGVTQSRLSQLITPSLRAYADLAVEMANDAALLSDMKQQVLTLVGSEPPQNDGLFDVTKFTHGLERLIKTLVWTGRSNAAARGTVRAMHVSV